MSKQIPVWRTVSHDVGGSRQCQWSLVPKGHLTVAQQAHPVGGRPLRVWSSDVEAFLREVSTDSGLAKYPKTINEKMNCCWSQKENMQPDILDVKSQHLNTADEKLHSASLHKRGVLTDNSEACNGSITTFKRRRRFEVPSKKHDEGKEVFNSLRNPEVSLCNENEMEISSSEFGKEQLHQYHMKNQAISSNSEKKHIDPYVNVPTTHEYQFQTATKDTLCNTVMEQAFESFSEKENLGSNYDVENVYMNKGDNENDLLINGCMGANINVFGNQCCNDKMSAVSEQRCNPGSSFQMASGKSVTISKAATERAMSLFNENCEINSEHISSYQHTERKLCSRGQEMKGYSDNNQCLQSSMPAPLFQTGTGKLVSESGMKLPNALFNDQENAQFEVCQKQFEINIISKESEMGGSRSCGISKIGNDIWNPSSCFNDKNLMEPNWVASEKPNDSVQEIRNPKPLSGCLFQTGSGKPVSISESAMKRAQSLLDDRESLRAEDHRSKMNAGNVSCLPAAVARKDSYESHTPSSGCLFQTAAGKTVSVSEAGMKKALKLFCDSEVPHPKIQTRNAAVNDFSSTLTQLNCNLRKFENPLPDPGSLFKTAAGNDVIVSQAGMQRAMELLSDKEVYPVKNQTCNSQMSYAISESDFGSITSFPSITKNSNDNLNNFENQAAVPGCLFQTAAGKKVTISETGLKRAMELFSDVEGNADATTETSNGKQLVTSENMLPTSGSLFQTAAGKKVSISVTGLNRAMELFNDAEVSNVQNGAYKVDFVNGNLDSDSSIFKKHKPESSLNINRNHNKIKNDTSGSGCLFQTAAGNKVCVSEVGMKRAMELFTDAEVSHVQNQTCNGDMDFPISDNNSTCHKNHAQPPHLSKFSAPQGTSATLTTAMQMGTKTLEKENYSFQSSTSARSKPMRLLAEHGKALSVSSSAMKRARDILGVDNRKLSESMHKLDGLNGDSQQLFETEGGHIVKVSSGSIQRAKVLLGEASFNNTMVPDRGNGQLINKNCPQVSRLPIQTRKGAGPRKFVASFKAPRRLHPIGILPTTAPISLEVHKQSSEPDYLQLVKMLPLNWKHTRRKSVQEFFKRKPYQDAEIRLLSTEVQNVTAETAKHYKFYTDVPGFECIGSGEFRQMLHQAGLNSEVLTKEWVDNHFRWIVWKLASLERSYTKECANKFFNIQTVFSELRYRYEREVNSAHRSALKKVTEGDATAGSMMTLCVATICRPIKSDQETSDQPETSVTNDVSQAVGIELTDGWYSIIAQLDQPLAHQLRAGKIFIGQKLRICRATLVGCTTPMPPLEAFQSMKLAIHINGTYRAHWGDKLGFYKGTQIPIALRCVKHDGGLVPRTVLAINRVYPILYHERLPENRSITRCARAEELAMCGYQHRRSQIAEDTILRMENDGAQLVAGKNIEGEKLFQALESSAEPELLMADMTAAQHAAFAAYQSKRQAARQELIEKQIKKVLGEKCLDKRDVTPFVRLNVTGVKYDGLSKTDDQQKLLTSTITGIVTIWQVTEEQVDNLSEGGVYHVSDLYPSLGKSGNKSSDRNVLNLRSTKSTMWQLIPKARCSSFSPRYGVEISELGNLPFSSEFDTAVLVLCVGKPYGYGIHQRQWIFVSDGSVEANVHERVVALLAIDICMLSDAFIPVEKSLEGSVIGYCNLVKRHRDQKNSLWVSEASENAVFSSNLSARNFAHLRGPVDKVNKWAKASGKEIKQLQERVKMAIGDGDNC